MTSTYTARFTRYDNRLGESRQSSRVHINAEGFDDAHRQANLRLRGMRDADPERRYDLTLLRADGYRHTVSCEGMGSTIWESDEEWHAREAAKLAPSS